MVDTDTFRRQTRQWLEDNCPPSMRTRATQEELYWGGKRAEFVSDEQRQWFECMRERGWLAPDWPGCYGGGGLSAEQHDILKAEMAALGCRPPLVGMGLWMIGPTILKFGTEAQKKAFLPPIANGEIRWCQGYSEPQAGSDLASLQCRGEVKDDHFVVNGSKIWNSMTDQSDWMFVLLRTGPQEPKHDGISFVLVDLNSPGISIKPIKLINGNSDFCQTFFDDVVIPRENLLGEINQGWTVAKYLLVFERIAMTALTESFSAPKPDIVDLAKRYLPMVDGKLSDAAFRFRVSEQQMSTRAVQLTRQRIEEEFLAGLADAGQVAGIMKYATTENERDSLQLSMDILGVQGLGWEGDSFTEEELQVTRDALLGYGLTIAGGTSEVQLNIVAKRILGLPE